MTHRLVNGKWVEMRLGDLRPLKRRERPFEYALRDRLKEMGVMFVKTKPTITGFPDRLAIGLGCLRLVEVKRGGGELSETQALVHRDIARHGPPVIVVEGPDVTAAADAVWYALGGQ